ncbi:MAG: Sjogren's syndrome/scleroderma autoantigen 1 family protein [Candidatus Bathyarchaeia archaeon]
MTEKSKDIQQMVDMLKQGATLTELSCPACASPLFRFKSGELWCAKCEKRVIVLKEGETAEKVTSQARLTVLENTILTKIQAVEKKISREEDAEELQKLNTVLASLLENLERLKKMKET